MKLKLLSVIILIILTLNLRAENIKVLDSKSLFKKISREYISNNKSNRQLSDQKENIILTTVLQRKVADNIFLSGANQFVLQNFPINAVGTSDIFLKRSMPATDANTKWYAQTKDGIIERKGPMIESFYGIVKDDDNSKIFLTYSNGRMLGYIKSSDGINYDITTSAETFYDENPTIVISQQNIKFNNTPDAESFKCLTDDSEASMYNEKEDITKNNFTLGNNSNLLECGIYLEGDNSYYKIMGSNYDKASFYMAAVMAHVSRLYEEFINVRIYIPGVLIWEDGTIDPYRNDADLENKLSTMPGRWTKLPTGADLVCLFASLKAQPAGDIVAGISFGGQPGKGSLCNNNRGYSVFGINGDNTYPNYNYTWDVCVAAHEIGHNFGAPHTHSCYYSPNLIDTCVTKSKPVAVSDACLDGNFKAADGTIMSYCHLSNATHSVKLEFHPRQIPGMRQAAEKAACMNVPVNPVISFLSPLKDNLFAAGDNIEISWTSSKVNHVNILFSKDNGKSWDPVQINIAANDSIFNWKAPAIDTKLGLFIIQDSDNPGTADTTDINISIIIPAINCFTPFKGLEYGQREKIQTEWTSNYSKKFDVLFSSDNGITWNLQAQSLQSLYYQFDAPDIISSDCMIKIIDSDNKDIIAESPVFAIGKETLTILSPKNGEVICGGNNYNITWKSDFVHTVYINYSINNGVNWKKIKITGINAADGVISWIVPKTFSAQAKIKITLFDDPTVLLDQTDGIFTVDTCNITEVDNEIPNQITGNSFEIISISPNPVTSVATIHYDCRNSGIDHIELSIADINGRIVNTEKPVTVYCGFNSVDYNLGGLPNGSYLLYSRYGDKMSSLKFTVTK